MMVLKRVTLSKKVEMLVGMLLENQVDCTQETNYVRNIYIYNILPAP